MLRALLFDLDGTLMDHDAARDAGFAAHLPEHAALAGEWRRLEALHYDTYAAGRCTFQEQRRRRVRGVHAALGHAEPADDEADAWFARYLAHYRAAWAAFDDVAPALAALGDLPLGIVTNGEGEPQRAKLAAIGLTGRFDVFVASAEVGLAKPDPAIFRLACERLGVDPAETAHVGDRLDLDARGAADAGLRAVWLDRSAAGDAAAAAGIATIATLHDLAAALA